MQSFVRKLYYRPLLHRHILQRFWQLFDHILSNNYFHIEIVIVEINIPLHLDNHIVLRFTHYNSIQFYRKQGSICETRKGPNRPPIRRGIDYLVYAMFQKITAFGHFRFFFWWLKVSKGTYTSRSFIWNYSHVSTTIDTEIEPGKAHVSKNQWFMKFLLFSANLR